MSLWLCLIAALATPSIANPNSPTQGQAGTYRITSGQFADIGQFPYQALIFSDGMTPCAGSLISKASVLTAAHCTTEFKTFYVRLGGVHLVGFEPSSWTVVSTNAVANPQFHKHGGNSNDIAVIILPVEAPISRHIFPVTLPSMYEVYESFVGQQALLAGWGWASVSPVVSDTLQWTTTTVISNKACQLEYMVGWIVPTMLCTADLNSNQGGCLGDSGSALVIRTLYGYKQIGVLSFGPLDCDPKVPTVYTRLTPFLNWLAKPV